MSFHRLPKCAPLTDKELLIAKKLKSDFQLCTDGSLTKYTRSFVVYPDHGYPSLNEEFNFFQQKISELEGVNVTVTSPDDAKKLLDADKVSIVTVNITNPDLLLASFKNILDAKKAAIDREIADLEAKRNNQTY